MADCGLIQPKFKANLEGNEREEPEKSEWKKAFSGLESSSCSCVDTRINALGLSGTFKMKF